MQDFRNDPNKMTVGASKEGQTNLCDGWTVAVATERFP